MSETAMLYRLIILNLLERADMPLTGTQITEFMLEKDYTTYFRVQQILSELKESGLVRTEAVYSNTLYEITEEGKQTLSYFDGRISSGIRADVDDFCRKQGAEIEKRAQIHADYDRSTFGDYAVHCVRVDRGHPLIDLTLSVPSKETAEAICVNWQNSSDRVFELLMDELVK